MSGRDFITVCVVTVFVTGMLLYFASFEESIKQQTTTTQQLSSTPDTQEQYSGSYGSLVEVITLKDGSRCAIVQRASGAVGIDCNWEPSL